MRTRRILLVLLIVACSRDEAPHVEPATATGTAAQPDTGPAAVVRAYVDAFNAKDLDAMIAKVAPDLVWMQLSGDSLEVGGRSADAFRQLLAGYVREVPAARSELQELHALGPWVTAHDQTRWNIDPASGDGQSSIAVYEVRSERIQRIWYYPAEPLRSNQPPER